MRSFGLTGSQQRFAATPVPQTKSLEQIPHEVSAWYLNAKTQGPTTPVLTATVACRCIVTICPVREVAKPCTSWTTWQGEWMRPTLLMRQNGHAAGVELGDEKAKRYDGQGDGSHVWQAPQIMERPKVCKSSRLFIVNGSHLAAII